LKNGTSEELFRNILQTFWSNRVYWKQRRKIKWATLGDENTKFFHSTATIRKNKNGIRSLIDDQGLEKFGHDEKASILWESFRSRLGVSEFTHMYIDLPSLLHRTDNLHILEEPFSQE
jgi:hypothetical protein